ncbi:M14 family metallopeptidase [Actinacidiphila oryziradicis]|uniref:Murein peptide amidase A n=1 Tax=Actinacidiphila oryziradicis TaxID=2571141 RepID=A0A4U0SU34_9ACTN|nr:murein peptide amidase A [Actinacidiphila oryziradicis]TKA13058.1 murein peptide amidase A [Actinacidiphila oryziradicis]
MDIDAYVSEVRDHDHFPSLDELDDALAAIPGWHTTIGTSRLGEPLRLLSIGTGSRDVLLLGGPHPNEPVGFLTVLETARIISEAPELADGADCTWHFVPCIDPDAARLNEGWYGQRPLTLPTYLHHFHRPALAHQPEWTFPLPLAPAPLPETRALMRLIDALRPHVQLSSTTPTSTAPTSS